MQKKRAIFIVAGLLGICLLLFGLLSNGKQTTTVSVKTESLMIKDQEDQKPAAVEGEKTEEGPNNSETETDSQIDSEKAPEEEGLPDAADTNKEESSITREIKKKIREVLKGTLNLFKKDLKIVAIGDSLTQGVGDETESGGYVGILNHTFEDNQLNVSVENYGKRGNRTDQLLKRLENKKIASTISKSDVVLITIGANDIMKVLRSNIMNISLEPFEKERVEYQNRLTDIFTKINELNPETQIYLIGFYNPFENYFEDIKELELIMNNWNSTGKSVTEEFENVHYIPTADLFDHSTSELLADDHFHPNTTGYKLMAERVLHSINEIEVETESSTEDE